MSQLDFGKIEKSPLSMSLEELNEKKAELEARLRELNREMGYIDEAIYENFESVGFQSMVGKCFYYKNGNGYDKDWLEFSRIVSYNKETSYFRVLRFYDSGQEMVLKLISEPADYYKADSCVRRTEMSEDEFFKKYKDIKSTLGGWA